MAETDQAGAPVLCFGNFPVALGATTRAVIVPLAPASMPLWREVRRDDKLRMYEGSRVCGIANVQWSAATRRLVPDEDQARFTEMGRR